MPAEESTPAIVLRARDYSESDRIVTLLTRDAGKLSGIAKGAKASRRRFERKLEPFSHVMLFYRRRPHGQLVFITRAESAALNPFNLENELESIALGSYMLELAEALAPEGADASHLYHLLAEALGVLGAPPEDNQSRKSLKHAFELKLLAWAGFAMEFGRCRACAASCLSDGSVFFAIARGGIICRPCHERLVDDAFVLDGASAMALAALSAQTLADAPALAAPGVAGSRAVSRFIASVLDRRLRSAEFLDSLELLQR